MTSTLLELCQQATQTVSFGRASQSELDEIGLLLDELERVEAFLETNCSDQDRRDAEVEFNTLTDRIDLLIEKV